MNTKTLLAALAGAVASFLLGWLVYGIIMGPMYESHTIHYEGLMNEEMNAAVLIPIFIGGFASSLLIAIICSWSKMVGLMKGAVIGGTVGFLMGLNFDMFMSGMMNFYTGYTIIIIDVLVGTVFTAIIGAVIGYVMGMGDKGAAAA